MSLLVALLGSTFFLSNAMKAQYNTIIDSYPDIVLTQLLASKETTIDTSLGDKLLVMNGVSGVNARLDAKYTFKKAKTNFRLVGIDAFESYANETLNSINASTNLADNSMLVSASVKKILEKNYYQDYFNFIRADGTLLKVKIAGTFKTDNALDESSLMVINTKTFRDIVGYKETQASDLAITVANKEEVGFIASKIALLLPNTKVVVKDDLRVMYENIYNFRSGFFLSIFIISFFTFFIIIYDKMSGLNSEQKREIGILKALGWRVGDVLNAKLYEGLIISLSAYVSGIVLALTYVYVLHAPLLKNIFLNNYDLIHSYNIEFTMDYETLALLFFLSVPIYIAATIIPAWQVATLDAEEVMR